MEVFVLDTSVHLPASQRTKSTSKVSNAVDFIGISENSKSAGPGFDSDQVHSFLPD